MKRMRPASATFRELSYDDQMATLSVTFRSGARYEYFLVPPAVVEELFAAESIGRYFTERIRGKFGERLIP